MAAAFIFSGCQSVPTNESQLTIPTVPLTIFKYHIGNDAGLSAYNVSLVNSIDDLEALGSTDLIKQDIDLDKVSLVVLSLGEQSTAGYEPRITAVQLRGNELFVQGQVKRPGPNDVVAQVVTYPVCAVEIEKVYAATVHPEIE